MGLKEARLSAGLTQAQAAEKLGVTRTTIAMWECGRSLPRAKLLKVIADLYNCTVEKLITSQPA